MSSTNLLGDNFSHANEAFICTSVESCSSPSQVSPTRRSVLLSCHQGIAIDL